MADTFITHCGMNSVSEALYFGVPLVMFPQIIEQGGVANRTAELSTGIFLKKNTVKEVLENQLYKQCAEKIAIDSDVTS